jgi:sn-glycerol 3-phosphate transport system permease protein
LAIEKRVRFKSWWLPWALVAPQMAVVLVFFFWPAGQALFQSVLREDAFGTSSEFVGLENFRQLFADETYLASFKTTAVFSLLVASIGLALSLLLAVMADRVVRGATFYKTLLIWPYAVAPAVAGVLWLFMFAPSIGIVSFWLRAVGVDWNHLLDSGDAMILIVMAAVWKQVSYNFLFFLAGLQSIPKSLIEAAAIDGAGPWRRFFNITLPMISPALFFTFIVLTIAGLQVFTEVYTAFFGAGSTGAESPDAALMNVVYLFRQAFEFFNIGFASAMAWLLFALIMLVTAVQFLVSRRYVFYQGDSR